MELTYLGTNTLVIKKQGHILVVDPHFSRPGLFRLLRLCPDLPRIDKLLQRFGINQLDAVLLTHTHYDHALDFPMVIKAVGGRAYGSNSAHQIWMGAGLPEARFHSVQSRKRYQIGACNISFHPSRHISFPSPLSWLLPESGRISAALQTPAPFWAYRCGEVYAIQVDQTLILGSAGFEPGGYADLALGTVILGIGGLESKPDAYLQQLYQETVLATGAERVWLSHWDNFFRPLDHNLQHLAFSGRSVRRIKDLGKAYGQRVEPLPFNQPIDVQ